MPKGERKYFDIDGEVLGLPPGWRVRKYLNCCTTKCYVSPDGIVHKRKVDVMKVLGRADAVEFAALSCRGSDKNVAKMQRQKGNAASSASSSFTASLKQQSSEDVTPSCAAPKRRRVLSTALRESSNLANDDSQTKPAEFPKREMRHGEHECAACGKSGLRHRQCECWKTLEEIRAAAPKLQMDTSATATNGKYPFCRSCYNVHFLPKQRCSSCGRESKVACKRTPQEIAATQGLHLHGEARLHKGKYPFCKMCYERHIKAKYPCSFCGKELLAACWKNPEEIAAAQLQVRPGSQMTKEKHPFCLQCYQMHFVCKYVCSHCGQNRHVHCWKPLQEIRGIDGFKLQPGAEPKDGKYPLCKDCGPFQKRLMHEGANARTRRCPLCHGYGHFAKRCPSRALAP